MSPRNYCFSPCAYKARLDISEATALAKKRNQGSLILGSDGYAFGGIESTPTISLQQMQLQRAGAAWEDGGGNAIEPHSSRAAMEHMRPSGGSRRPGSAQSVNSHTSNVSMSQAHADAVAGAERNRLRNQGSFHFG